MEIIYDKNGIPVIARFTGNDSAREETLVNFFSGPYKARVSQREYEEFVIVHPDDVTPGMQTITVPEVWQCSLGERPVGVGISLGLKIKRSEEVIG